MIRSANPCEQVPHELRAILSDQDLFANPSELSTKDILKKAELYLREGQRLREQDHRSEPYHAHKNGQRGEVKHVRYIRTFREL